MWALVSLPAAGGRVQVEAAALLKAPHGGVPAAPRLQGRTPRGVPHSILPSRCLAPQLAGAGTPGGGQNAPRPLVPSDPAAASRPPSLTAGRQSRKERVGCGRPFTLRAGGSTSRTAAPPPFSPTLKQRRNTRRREESWMRCLCPLPHDLLCSVAGRRVAPSMGRFRRGQAR